MKFPANYHVLVACVIGYCGFNTLLQLYITYVEKGIVLFTKKKEGGSAATASGVAVRCKMLRFSEEVTITVMRGDAQDASHEAAVGRMSDWAHGPHWLSSIGVWVHTPC